MDGTNSVLGVNGTQALRVTALTGNPAFNIVNENTQYRMEENSTGATQNYLINVLQARDASGANVVSSLTQDAPSWTIQLDHPTLGHAVIVLNKGAGSSGGAVGYSAGGVPTTLTPLLDHVQSIQVNDNGGSR